MPFTNNIFDKTGLTYGLILPFDISKRFSGCDVIDDDDPVRTAIVSRGYGPKSFLTGGVPNLKLHPDVKK